MAKHIIFLVHGMGVYGKMADGAYEADHGWFKQAEADLREIHDRFIKDEASGRPAFDERYKLVELEYDSILERFRTAWKAQSESWTKLELTGGVADLIQGAFDSNKDNAFLWTHFADTALYYAPTVREHVKSKLAEEILKHLGEAKAASSLERWSIVGHSLGSAVTHDVLTDIKRFLADKPALEGAFWPPRLICMAANVARILTDDEKLLYSDTLAPTGSHNPDGYISCNHRLDPFTLIAPFAPNTASWASENAVFHDLTGLSGYYLAKEVIEAAKAGDVFDAVATAVPHGFGHYMRQPEVIATLWPSLMGDPPSDYPDLEDTVRQAYADDLRAEIAAAVSEKVEAAHEKVGKAVEAKVEGKLKKLFGMLETLA